MQINSVEQDILYTVHELPIEKQREILDFSLFLKNTLKKQVHNDVKLDSNISMVEITINQQINNEPSAFRTALRQFLKKVEQEPIDIDTSIFDSDRKNESSRYFQYFADLKLKNWFD
jgi:hypothetical protein